MQYTQNSRKCNKIMSLNSVHDHDTCNYGIILWKYYNQFLQICNIFEAIYDRSVQWTLVEVSLEYCVWISKSSPVPSSNNLDSLSTTRPSLLKFVTVMRSVTFTKRYAFPFRRVWPFCNINTVSNLPRTIKSMSPESHALSQSNLFRTAVSRYNDV